MARRRRGSFRLNAKGWVFLALSASVAFAAAFKSSNYLLLVFCGLMGVWAVSGWLTWLVARGIEVSRVLPEEANAGCVIAVALRVRNAKRFWPAFCLRLEDRLTHGGQPAPLQPPPVWIPLAGPGQRARGVEHVSLQSRGWARLGPILLTSEFTPGLWTYRTPLAVSDRLLVFPRLGVLNRRILNPLLARVDFADFPSLESVRGQEEFAGLREYREGDNRRHVHWKMSARLPGRLLVREYDDPLIREGTLLLETFVPNPGDARRRGRFERAVSFAATLAETLLAENWRLTFKAWGPDYRELRLEPQRGSREELLHSLALLKPTRIHPLSELLQREEDGAGRVCFVIRCGDEPLAEADPQARRLVFDPHDQKGMMEFDL
jgi:uncharacterized protein (DUF58 family)